LLMAVGLTGDSPLRGCSGLASLANRAVREMLLRCFVALLLTGVSRAQVAQKGSPNDADPARQGIALAERGRCTEALPLLKKAASPMVDKQLTYRVGMATARCAMSVDQTESVVRALLLLRREFPHDPEVLYITTHFYSELASRASQELAATAPTSSQAQELDAEAFESQGKWDEAAAEYRKVLEQDPHKSGVHYRLGRIALAKPASAAATAEARKEFEAEIKVDPTNASTEFMLGEIARQSGQWDQAILHFSQASKLDDGFSDALLALGISLNSAERFRDAVSPLEHYIKMQPSDPAGHYQLAIAYARTGNKDGADRQMALQRAVSAKPPGTRTESGADGPR
jgi:tetratricopeptide (TPR) repeat protein